MFLDVVSAPGSEIDFHGGYFFEAVLEIEWEASGRGFNVCGEEMGVCESKTPFYELGGGAEAAVGWGGAETCEDFEILAYGQKGEVQYWGLWLGRL